MGKVHRVVLVEDHPLVREGLRATLADVQGIAVVAEAENGVDALRCVEQKDPDLVILDLSLPQMDGIAVLQEIKRRRPQTRVLIFTVHRAEKYVYEALRAGAEGYVLKLATAAELATAVLRVLEGHRYLSPQIATEVIAGYLSGSGADNRLPSPLAQLTQREREVLQLVAEGYRNREVADLLCISARTVEKHRGNLMRKLNLRSVQALTTYAIENGITEAP